MGAAAARPFLTACVRSRAGEWPGSVSNIEYALGFSTLRRIGHGVELAGQPELQRQLRDRGITVECCMTSNVGGKKVRACVCARVPARRGAEATCCRMHALRLPP